MSMTAKERDNAMYDWEPVSPVKVEGDNQEGRITYWIDESDFFRMTGIDGSKILDEQTLYTFGFMQESRETLTREEALDEVRDAFGTHKEPEISDNWKLKSFERDGELWRLDYVREDRISDEDGMSLVWLVAFAITVFFGLLLGLLFV